MYLKTKIRPVRTVLTGLIFLLFNSIAFCGDYHCFVEKYTLPNGLTVILEEDHSSSLVSIQVWIRSGSCFEGEFLGSGITHLIEHMVFKGETSRTSKWISEEIQRLGGDINAATSKEYTQFDVVIPSENLNNALSLIYRVIAMPEFPEEELKKEKDVILHEMDMIQDDPHKYMVQEFFKKAFSGHPYGEPVGGNKSLFSTIKREDVLEYYKSRYVPRNMMLVVTGDFKSDVLKSDIEKNWGKIPDAFVKQVYIPDKPQVKGYSNSILESDKGSFYIMLGFYSPSIVSPDYYAMDVLAQIAGGSEESRLRKKIRDKDGLVSNISAFNYTPICEGIWGVSADLTISEWDLVYKNILKEIYRFREKLVTKKELERAKKILIRQYISSLETTSGKAFDLGSSELYTHNPLFMDTYISGIKSITREELKDAAQKYFRFENLTFVVVSPKSKGVNKKTKDILSKDIEKIDLTNGMRVLVKEKKRTPIVTIRLTALGGLLEEDIPGLSYFVSQLWLKEYADIVKEIETKGGGISAYSGFNSIGCVMEVFKEDAEFAIQSLDKLIQDIRVEKDKFEIAKKIQLAEIQQEEDRPYAFTLKRMKNVFFGEHPYKNSLLGDEKAVSNIAEEDVKKFFNKCFSSPNIIISIFGDIASEEVKRICENTLEKKKGNAFVPNGEFSCVPEKINNIVINKKIEQAIIVLAYPSPSIYDKERYSMELIEQAFSGQAGRLFESVREKQGLAYSVGALNFNGRQPGFFVFYVATKPEEIERAKQILLGEVVRLKTEDMGDEELRRIKNRVITEKQEAWESMQGLSLQVSSDELYGLGWDNYKKYKDNIEKITKEDIKNAVEKYFRDDWYTFIILCPDNSDNVIKNKNN
jgi:zinc protease